jgi:hypothetical protein
MGSEMRLRQRPMIGATRQNPKILAPHGCSFSSNALAGKVLFAQNGGCVIFSGIKGFEHGHSGDTAKIRTLLSA